jgi:hypothetical protein
MTRDERHLDLSLERFPAYVDAFFERSVVKTRDVREKRFNFAVAAWCVANSCAYDLRRFYREHRRMLKTLFGENAVRLKNRKGRIRR